ncbi:MAG: glycosyltransferase family 2 protein [Sphingobacteriia bacterium]|nr:MAG: glycosyltransferase family 2 protein [Sphingobacteriia bacterium]
MHPSVAVVLVNWNSFEETNNCINSLYEITYTNYSIILVDNGSSDGSGKLLEQTHRNIKVLYNEQNTGFTGGNNKGLEYAIEQGFAYSMMLNNDTYVEANFLEPLVNYMQNHPKTGVIQPRIHFNHDRSLLWNGGSYYSKWLGRAYTKGYQRVPTQAHLNIKEVDWVTGCCFLTRNSILQASGLLIEKMFIYSEDVDLSFRIRRLRYSLVYHPESVIYHIAGMSNKNKNKGKEGYVNPIVHYLNLRNKIWLLKKYTPWFCAPSVVTVNSFYMISLLAYFGLRGRFVKLKTALKAIKDGLRGSI